MNEEIPERSRDRSTIRIPRTSGSNAARRRYRGAHRGNVQSRVTRARERKQPGGMISSSAKQTARDDTVRQGAAAGYRDPIIGRDRGRVGLIIDQSGAFALPRAESTNWMYDNEGIPRARSSKRN